MKILLGEFNRKVGIEDILKPTVVNEDLHEVSNNNGVAHQKIHEEYNVHTSQHS
jgi:hypothetical protein